MKIAVIGSRSLVVNNLEKYLPKDVDEIVSGGAIGIDRCAKEYAIRNNITLREFLPEYNKFGRSAPLKRNIEIIEYSDAVLAFGTDILMERYLLLRNVRKSKNQLEFL